MGTLESQASAVRRASRQRRPWQSPVLTRLRAGEAEVHVAGNPDAGVNFS
jgi:glycerate-2-kinase